MCTNNNVMRIQTKIETYCEILSFFIIKLIADDHTLQMQAFIVKNIFGVCVIDDSLKQKDDEYLTNSYLRLSPITRGFILFHELLRCWLRGSTGHLSFVILQFLMLYAKSPFLSYLNCILSSQPSLNVNSLCSTWLKGLHLILY